MGSSVHDREMAEIRQIMAQMRRDEARWRAEEKQRRAEEDKRRAKEKEEWKKYRAEEAARRAEERAEEKEERKKRRAEEAARHAAEDKRRAEFEAKWQKQMSDLTGQWGDSNNAEGEMMEDEIAQNFARTRRIGRYRIVSVGVRLLSVITGREFDAVCETDKGDTIVAEVKRTLSVSDVRKFVSEQLPLFAESFPGLARGRVIGAIIYARRRKMKNGKGKDPVQEALDAGLLVIRATGNNELQQIKSVAEADIRIDEKSNGKGNGKSNGKSNGKKR